VIDLQAQAQPNRSGVSTTINDILNDPALQQAIHASNRRIGRVEQTPRGSAVGLNNRGELEIFINPGDGGINPKNGRSLAQMVRFQTPAPAPPPGNISLALSNNPDLLRIVQQPVSEGYMRDAEGNQYYIFGGAGAETTNFGKSPVTLLGPAAGGGKQKYTFQTPEAAFQAGKTADPRHWAGLANCHDGDAAKRYVRQYTFHPGPPGWHSGDSLRHMRAVVSARATQDPNFRQLLLHLASNNIEPVEIAMMGVPGKSSHNDNTWAAQVTQQHDRSLVVAGGRNNRLGRIMKQEGENLLALERPGTIFPAPQVPFQPAWQAAPPSPLQAPPPPFQAPPVRKVRWALPTPRPAPTPPARQTTHIPRPSTAQRAQRAADATREARLRAFHPRSGKHVLLPRNFQGTCVHPSMFPHYDPPPRGKVAIAVQRRNNHIALVYVQPTRGTIRVGERIICKNSRMYASGRLASPAYVPTRLTKQSLYRPLRKGESLNATYRGMTRRTDGTILHVFQDPRRGRVTISASQMKAVVGTQRLQQGEGYTLRCDRTGKITMQYGGKNLTNNVLRGNSSPRATVSR
jgi:hypothetical protein